MKEIIVVELIKLKGSKIFWIVILAPAFMVLQGAVNLLRYYDLFTGQGQNAWEQLYTQSMIFYVMILFPVLISVVMTLVARMENAHHGWKQYLSLPVKKEVVYTIKFIIACGVIFINILALLISILISGFFLGLEGNLPWQNFIVRPMAMYVAALPVMAVLYVVSIRHKQMTIPLGIGIGLALPAMLVANSKFWLVYPWTYPIMAALGVDMDLFSKGPIVYFVSIILLIIVFLSGSKNFCQKDII
ncbi:MAG: ABC transporter permease subunit [Firmicutes bacterium]|nr:ABC transporter permease subunit [Bacillota bacterium]